MSYPQLGYPYSSAPQFLMATNSLTACCDSSGRTLAESAVVAASPQTPVYCPVYESRFLATARHDLNPAATLGVYGSPYASGQCYGNYVTCGTDASAFYSLSTFDTKDGTSAAAGLSQASAYYPYDPALGQYQYDRYGPMDGSARRKNATRETTSTLKAWLQEHRKNPYPTKGEKIMLAIITKMTLTQVSTWFANARRRLKKENKMTWPPRTKNSDEKGFNDDDEKSQDEPVKSENKEDENRIQKDKNLQLSDLEDFDSIESESIECELKHQFHVDPHMRMTGCRSDRLKGTAVAVPLDEDEELTKGCLRRAPGGCQPGGEEQLMLPEKPKIWSLAQTAASLNEAEYSSCMHKCLEMVPSSPGFSRPASDTDRQQDSPVATLRNWIDGVFHEPLFRHRSLNQALANTTVSWASPKSVTQEMLGPSVGNNSIKEHITSLQHHDSHKDRMVFPKTGDKVFCSE